MDVRDRLLQPHLTVVSAEPDFDLRAIGDAIRGSVVIDGRAALEQLLCELLAEADRGAPVAAKTLDLIGHARSRSSLLALGDWLIDAASPVTVAFFRELAEHDVLPRLGIRALRLLGCQTAATVQGRATIEKLSELLGVEVWGARQLLHTGHWGGDGFADCWQFLLTSASELARGSGELVVRPAGDPYPRVLDVDALPAVALGEPPVGYPRRIATPAAAREIFSLVRRREGARMPGLVADPCCELALPAMAGGYHIADVMLAGEFLRFDLERPGGIDAPDGAGILFPVDDAVALRRIVGSLSGQMPAPDRARR